MICFIVSYCYYLLILESSETSSVLSGSDKEKPTKSPQGASFGANVGLLYIWYCNV